MKLLTTALYTMGIGSWIWAATAAFLTGWYWVLIILGAVLIIVGEAVRYVAEDPYETTVYGVDETIRLGGME